METIRWEGKAAAQVNSASAGQVWALLEDFGSIHKWIPNLHSCSIVEGAAGQLGCLRRSAGPPIPGSEADSFTIEKLVAFDPVQRRFSYQVLDNNIGFHDFVGTIWVSPDGDEGCTIEWSFVADPMQTWTQEQIVEYVGLEVQTMAKRMGEALKTA